MELWKRFRQFLDNVWKELKRVSWPSKKEVQGTTLVVLITVIIMSIYLGLLDFLFGAVSRFMLIGTS